MILNKIRNKIMMWKIYIHRANSYVAIVNSGMILVIFLRTLKTAGYIKFDLNKYYIIILFFGLIAIWCVGWLEKKLGGTTEEYAIGFELTPQFVEMKRKIDELYDLKFNKEEDLR